ncbi:MAG: type II toxin-antitoxin system Phd/YefM family antitoxin [Thermomicrobiales bacterium]
MATRPDTTWGAPVDRKVSASEAKNSFGKLVAWVREEHEPVIVENRGIPVAALISYEELEEFQEMKWRKKAAQALEDLKQLQREVSSRPANRNLTEEEAWALGKRAINETLEEMEAEGKISFEH